MLCLRYLSLALVMTAVVLSAPREAHADDGAGGFVVLFPPMLALAGAMAGSAPVLATNDVDHVRFGFGYSSDPHAIGSQVVSYGYFNDGYLGTEGRASSSTWLDEQTDWYLDSDLRGGLLLRATPEYSVLTAEMAAGLTSGFEAYASSHEESYFEFSSGFYAGARLRAGCRPEDVVCLEVTGDRRVDWNSGQDGATTSIDYSATLELYPSPSEEGGLGVGFTYSGRAVDGDEGFAPVDHSLILSMTATID